MLFSSTARVDVENDNERDVQPSRTMLPL